MDSNLDLKIQIAAAVGIRFLDHINHEVVTASCMIGDKTFEEIYGYKVEIHGCDLDGAKHSVILTMKPNGDVHHDEYFGATNERLIASKQPNGKVKAVLQFTSDDVELIDETEVKQADDLRIPEISRRVFQLARPLFI